MLERRGVEVRCGESVKEVQSDRVVLGSGEVIASRLVIWAAGVGPCPLTQALEIPQVRGRVEVADDLRVKGLENVFAIGDMAAARWLGWRRTYLPQLAQPAIQGGRLVGKQICRLPAGEETVPFEYRNKGIMATIGRRAAVAELSRRSACGGRPPGSGGSDSTSSFWSGCATGPLCS